MKKAKHFIISALSTLVLNTGIVYAAPYQSELSLSYSNQDDDFIAIKTVQAAFSYYLSPVDTSKGPLAEAAF